MLVASSIKRALDLEWSDPEQKASALGILIDQLEEHAAVIALDGSPPLE